MNLWNRPLFISIYFKKKYWLCLTAIYGAWSACGAQTVREPPTIRYANLGVYSEHFCDGLAVGSNSAALAAIDQFSFAAYGEQRFFLKELSSYNLVASWPALSGAWGIVGNYLGHTQYAESQLGIGYGRKLSTTLDVGGRINYYQIRITGYGSAFALNYEAGAKVKLSENMWLGCNVYNPFGSRLGQTNETLSSIYKIGLGYEVDPHLLLSMELLKMETSATNFHLGLQYQTLHTVFFRGGVLTQDGSGYAGVGVMVDKRYRIDATASYHALLGFSPGLVLMYYPLKKKE